MRAHTHPGYVVQHKGHRDMGAHTHPGYVVQHEGAQDEDGGENLQHPEDEHDARGPHSPPPPQLDEHPSQRLHSATRKQSVQTHQAQCHCFFVWFFCCEPNLFYLG